jgi:hypothetical protein
VIDSGDYFWLSAEQHVGLGEAGCVTVVSGSTNEAALAAFGVEPEAAVVPIGPAAMQVAPNLAGVSSLGDGGV